MNDNEIVGGHAIEVIYLPRFLILFTTPGAFHECVIFGLPLVTSGTDVTEINGEILGPADADFCGTCGIPLTDRTTPSGDKFKFTISNPIGPDLYKKLKKLDKWTKEHNTRKRGR